MGYCRNSPELLWWKEPGLKCMKLSDLLHAASRGTMLVGLWRMGSLCSRLKDLCSVHVHAANGMPYFLVTMSARSLELTVSCVTGATSKVTPRKCRCPLTTCRLMLWQLFACRKGNEKLKALVYSYMPSFFLKRFCKHCLCCLCLWFLLLSPSSGARPVEHHCANTGECDFYTAILC